MPEGPSIVIAVEDLAKFKGKVIIGVDGNSKKPIQQLKDQKILDIFSFAKYLNFQFKNFGMRIHFMLFGSMRLNAAREDMAPRLVMRTKNNEAFFYNCSIQFFDEADMHSLYDFRIDIMSPQWDKKLVLTKIKELLKTHPAARVDDLLMNQTIFAGVGNIIKNEVLYRQKLLPSHLLKSLTAKQLSALVQDARDYSKQFYEWKKQFVLKKNYRIYRQSQDPLGHKVIHEKTGVGQCMSHYCPICQK